MSDLQDAICEGYLEEVKRLVAEGADVKEGNDLGFTALLWAAFYGHISIMDWLLSEGGSSLAEHTILHGTKALMLTAIKGHFPAVQYLLEERGVSISETNNAGDTVWANIRWQGNDGADLSSLLKVMVMLEDAPADFIATLSPYSMHADICTRGRQLRAQLPSYLEQQQATLVAHCPLPAVLQSVVTTYAVITPEDMWADGLRGYAPRTNSARAREAEGRRGDAPPPRRSLRLRQKRL
jgi:hypothetical protein